MSSAGRKLLSSLVYSGKKESLIDMCLFADLFKDGEVALYKFVLDHLNKFGVVPAPGTVEEKCGDVLVTAEEPPEYYLQEVERRYVQTQLKRILMGVHEHLNDQDPDKAMDTMLNMVSDLNLARNRKSLLDFRDVAGLIHKEYILTKQMSDTHSVMWGWPTLDGMTGGMRGGDFCSIVGRPASGKTFMELFVAQNAWDSGAKPLFVSMEMTNITIAQRLAAMKTHKPLTQLLKAMLTTKGYLQFKDILDKLKDKPVPFWLLDGNLASTVDDIILMARQLQPSVLYVDGAYLLRHPNPKVGRFEKITENAEWLKQKVATDLKIPVVATYQFNREVAKKKGKGPVKGGLEDIYGSDAIGQLSSVVLGLFEAEGIETQKRRKVEIVKGRNGETGEFIINWDFVGMNFDEVPSTTNSKGEVVEDTETMQWLG